jgi:hypothetical protein
VARPTTFHLPTRLRGPRRSKTDPGRQAWRFTPLQRIPIPGRSPGTNPCPQNIKGRGELSQSPHLRSTSKANDHNKPATNLSAVNADEQGAARRGRGDRRRGCPADRSANLVSQKNDGPPQNASRVIRRGAPWRGIAGLPGAGASGDSACHGNVAGAPRAPRAPPGRGRRRDRFRPHGSGGRACTCGRHAR